MNGLRDGAIGLALAALIAVPATAQHEGGGGGGGCGDVFGDLVHVLREPTTGQPILQKRWIEYPMDVFDWGYCPIPVDAAGDEIGFVELSCDPADPSAVVEVDYFGRLSGGRTKERNRRMHFDEVIAMIREAGIVKQDEAGRLKLGTDCTTNPAGKVQCSTWSVVDSPMANLSLYTRVMRYGHIQTDPLEVNEDSHGDPALPTQYHPALGPSDWPKFHQSVRHLLPRGADAGACFDSGGFDAGCSVPEALASEDFVRAASFLAGAADKGGLITVDLVQYINRILQIPPVTPVTLPPLVRVDDSPEYVDGSSLGLEERFVDFGATAYWREDWREETLEALVPIDAATWEAQEVQLLDWLAFANGPAPAFATEDIHGFVAAANDALRAIQFIHNYAVPEDLGWSFVTP